MFQLTNVNPLKIIAAIIGSTLLLSSFKYGIGYVEIVRHVYEKQNKTINEAIFISNTLPCNDSVLLMKWDGINEFCRSYFKIASRNILWETIVESSDYFHICYVKKHVHDENKKFGHSHASDNDVEIDCTNLIYFIFGIFIIFVIFLFLYHRIKKHLLLSTNKEKDE